VGRPRHALNRLSSSVQMTSLERRRAAQTLAAKLSLAAGPSVCLLPLNGIDEWDRPGQALHDPPGLADFLEALRSSMSGGTRFMELPCHINDPAFVEAALAVFDAWVEAGLIPRGAPV
jgi:uncharacterized protein (UPF0261 family)